MEGEHAEEAERGEQERDHARDHALAGGQCAVRFAQPVQLVDVLHGGGASAVATRTSGWRDYCVAVTLADASSVPDCAVAASARSRQAVCCASGSGAGIAPLTIAWIELAVVAASLLGGSTRQPGQHALLRRHRQIGTPLAGEEDLELLQPARVGRRLAFGAAHEHRVGAGAFEEPGEQFAVLGMGVVDDAQRRRAGERAEQLGDRVPGIAQSDDRAHGEQAGERRAERVGAEEGRLVPGPCRLDAGGVVRDREAEIAEDLGRGDPARIVQRPVHEDRHLVLREQHREQGGEVRELARAVVRRQHDGGPLEAKLDAALVHGVEEAGQLGDGLALDAHRHRERADLEIA